MNTLLPKRITYGLVLLAVFLSFAACSDKSDSGGGGEIAAVEQTVQVTEQPEPQDPNAVNKVLRDLSIEQLDFELVGLPVSKSPDSSVSITISSSQVSHYKWAFISEDDCSQATLSDWVLVSEPISTDLGGDGPKRLCFQLTGLTSAGVTAFGSAAYSWIKDSTPPSVSMQTFGGIGPNTFIGANVPLTGTVSDNYSGLSSVGVSLKEGSKCLANDQSGFSAGCPNYLGVSLGDSNAWSLDIDKSVFSGGNSYTFALNATDQAGNDKTIGNALTVTWDSTAPSTPGALSVTGGEEIFDVSWSAVSGASKYLIVRRKGSNVSYTPPTGIHFVDNQYLGNGHVVAYIGSATSFQDVGIDPNIYYYYKAFAIDGAYNIGGGVEDNDVATEVPRFKGIKWSNLTGDGLKTEVVWDPFTQGGTSHSLIEYEIFTSETSDGFDWESPVDSAIGDTRITFTIPPTAASSVFVAVRDKYSDGSQGENTSSVKLNLTGGYFHRIANFKRYEGLDPLMEINPINLYALDHDQWGNIIFADDTSFIYVYCLENSQAPYCMGRTVGKVYFIAGRDGRGDGEDEMIAAEAPSGAIYGLRVDLLGNIYFADNTYRRVRVICMAPAQPASAFCFQKKKGYVYHFAGNGAAGDGLDDSVALGEPMGNPRDLVVDPSGNVYIVDDDYRRIRLVCSDISSSVCSGKTAWNTYRVVGTAVNADGADNVEASISTMGVSYALDIDKLGNLYFVDNNYYRIRAVCYDVSSAAGFCAGKTTGNVYHVAGTGANDGDGPPGFVALGSKIGVGQGIQIDDDLNLWYLDQTYRRLRVICYDTTASGFCNGKNNGYIYWAAGDGSNIDGASGSEAVISGIGDPLSLSIDENGNAVTTDYRWERLRSICFDTASAGLCQGNNSGYQYHIVGNANAKKGPVDRAISTGVHIGDVSGVAKDSLGNIYFADTLQDIVRVLCNDVTGATGACAGREKGFVYRVAGTGSAADGNSDLPAHLTPIANPYGIAIDSIGNLYIADSTYERIRIVCYDVSSGGFCQGRNSGFVYRAYGTGVGADGANDVDAETTGMGTVYDVAIDSLDNVYIADAQYERVRVVCNEVASGGFCDSKTAGNVYHLAGTGTNADGDFGVATSTAMGANTALAIDSFDNVYVADTEYNRVRAVCIEVSSGGFCDSKTSGNMYRLAGSGSAGDGADASGATTEDMGDPYGLAVDSVGNIYIGDYDYHRIRIVCNENSTGFCNGKTIGNIYRAAGTGTQYNDPTNLFTADQTAIGSPARAGMFMDSNDLLLITDMDYDSIRVLPEF